MTRHDAMLEICRILLEFEIEQRQKVAESATGPSRKSRPAGAPQGQSGQAKIKRGRPAYELN